MKSGVVQCVTVGGDIVCVCVRDYSSGPLASCVGLIPARALLSLPHSMENMGLCVRAVGAFPYIRRKKQRR